MVIVAKARRLSFCHNIDLPSICGKILKKARSYRTSVCIESDGLNKWLQPRSVVVLRYLERAIQELFIESTVDRPPIRLGNQIAEVSSQAAFFYTALFRLLRDILNVFRSSNPTWIKTPEKLHKRLRPTADHIFSLFERHAAKMQETLKLYQNVTCYQPKNVRVNIEVASSISIPLPDNHVHAVVASPPYCTRIDYVIATKPELALLGYSDEDIKALRAQMIGTPTISEKIPSVSRSWGPSCEDFINKVAGHTSIASATYYLKTYLQYFSSIYISLTEISRTLEKSGYCVLVVQDSYYKDIHTNLPLIFIEMGELLGWVLNCRVDFAVKHSMVDINTKAKQYRRNTNAVESVLVFQKVK
jgi:hypothetical protein